MLQEVSRLGRQRRAASPRPYGNTRRRFEVGVAPVAITTLKAPPPSPQSGQILTFMIATSHDEHRKGTFKRLIINIFVLCQEHFFLVDLSLLNRDASIIYGRLISYSNLTTWL